MVVHLVESLRNSNDTHNDRNSATPTNTTAALVDVLADNAVLSIL